VGLELCPISLMSTIEKLLGRKSSGSRLELREYGRRDPSRSIPTYPSLSSSVPSSPLFSCPSYHSYQFLYLISLSDF
jgi:hypothetical protein